jgi:hypothetical protein
MWKWWLLAALCCSGCVAPRVWFWRSPDRLHSFEVQEPERGRQRVLIDAAPAHTDEAVGIEHVAWHPRGGFAWPALTPKGWVIRRSSGAPSAPFESIGALLFSPDGAHLAAAVQSSGLWTVLRDGEPGPWLDAVFEGSLAFSDDSRRLAWAGSRGARSTIVLDGDPTGWWDGVGSLAFAPGGARLGYVARRGDDAWAVIDGTPVGPFDAIAGLALGGAPSRFALLVRRAFNWRAIVDWQESGPHDALGPIRYSADGQHVAMFSRAAGIERVLVDGAPGETFEEILPASVTFAGDGSVSFVARAGKKWSVPPGPWFDEVRSLRAAEQSGAVAYAARRGRDWFVVAGEKESGPYAQVGTVELSADGKTCGAFVMAGGKTMLVLNGEARPAEGAIEGSLALSPDGRRMAWLASPPGFDDIWLFLDGAREDRLDLEEILAVEMKAPRGKRGKEDGTSDAIRQWVRAELEARAR